MSPFFRLACGDAFPPAFLGGGFPQPRLLTGLLSRSSGFISAERLLFAELFNPQPCGFVDEFADAAVCAAVYGEKRFDFFCKPCWKVYFYVSFHVLTFHFCSIFGAFIKFVNITVTKMERFCFIFNSKVY